jgi:hypothetical protein
LDVHASACIGNDSHMNHFAVALENLITVTILPVIWFTRTCAP